jgi:integrase
MNEPVWQLLRTLPRTDAPPFGGDRRSGDLWATWQTICRAAGLAGVRFHDLRHTAGTYMVEGGADLKTVQEILGHSTITLTARYTHPTPPTKARAVAAIPALLSARDGPQMDTTPGTPEAARALSVR